jgi:hypothetical protein
MASNGNVLGMICKCSTKSDHFEIFADTDKLRRCHMCNKFLTLGFGCEWEDVLRFQGRTLSLVFG